MTGTAKQIAWAEDIRTQVMEAAHEVYDAHDYNLWGVTFEESPVGHDATFAAEHMDAAKFWIDTVGYRITDCCKCTASFEGIISDIAETMCMYDLDAYEQYAKEEDEFRRIRHEKRDAYHEAKEAARMAANK